MTRLRSRMAWVLAARDPGHSRLVRATAITSGVLVSVLAGWVITHQLHADTALLSASVFLSLQAGNFVKGSTALQRLITTALLLPTILLVIGLALLVSSHRPVAILVFIVISGLAIWVRHFGTRAAALGGMSFIGYFFTLFMQPKGAELPAFLLIVSCAIFAQVLVRVVLLVRNPKREIRTLLHELREASSAMLPGGVTLGNPKRLKSLLAREDEVAQAIAQWQKDNSTAEYLACTPAELELRVLNARVETETAAQALVHQNTGHAQYSRDETSALAKLRMILTDSPSAAAIAEAKSWATGIINTVRVNDEPPSDINTAVFCIARATLAHIRLIEIENSSHSVGSARKAGTSDSPAAMATQPVATQVATVTSASITAQAAPQNGNQVSEQSFIRHLFDWRNWSTPSRLATQAMIAAALASVVGEAISASRWYWAVMTAFVIFIGVSTRGSVLTRAFRRILGTLAGIAIGTLAVALGGDAPLPLAIIALIAIFGMLYFGPLNYVYTVLFITTMLVAIYRMLGILQVQLLELRIGETLAGAAIGVLCAYFIMTASSRPALTTQVTGYFTALNTLLRTIREAQTPAGDIGAVLPALTALEARQSEAEQAVTAMSTALYVRHSRRESETVQLMHVTTRAGAQLAQAILPGVDDTSNSRVLDPAFTRAIDELLVTVNAAWQSLDTSHAIPTKGYNPTTASEQPPVMEVLPGPAGEALALPLTTMDWALRKVASLHPHPSQPAAS